MTPLSQTLIVIGGLLLVGLFAHFVGSRMRLPRVTLLLLLGLAVGDAGLDLLPSDSKNWFAVAATLALTMVGFLIGGELKIAHLRKDGRAILVITAVVSVMTAAIVGSGLLLIGTPFSLALTLAGIATATDAAATLAVIHESHSKGAFSKLLIRIVALDDVVALLLFSFLAAIGEAWTPGAQSRAPVLEAAREITGALGLGFFLGYPASKLTGRVRRGEPILEEALALLCLCAGLASWLHVSPLLTAMTMGATIANFAHHHNRTFRQVESIEWPFLVVFFILAGASLDPNSVPALGLVGGAYLVLRLSGKVLGGYLGAQAIDAPPSTRKWVGLALLPQAGVALGLALSAAERFPTHSEEIISITIVSTVLFELAGPIVATWALRAQNSQSRAS